VVDSFVLGSPGELTNTVTSQENRPTKEFSPAYFLLLPEIRENSSDKILNRFIEDKPRSLRLFMGSADFIENIFLFLRNLSHDLGEPIPDC
jgi:hypothetical protein